MPKPLRVGYFGGTFDPPHAAHLRVAQAAADACALDVVLVAPTGIQPLKDDEPHANFADRMAMVRLLCAEDDRLKATALDAPREDGSPNYTIAALDAVRVEYPGAEVFVVVGADSFLSLPRWHESHRLLAEAEWIVASRPGFDLDDLSELNLSPAELKRVHLLKDMDDDLSATSIRERLRLGISCGQMLTTKVALYIAKMHLYHAR